MIKQYTRIHVKFWELSIEAQEAIQFILENEEHLNMSMKWTVYDNFDHNTACQYETCEYTVNSFLMSNGIDEDTTIYIDL